MKPEDLLMDSSVTLKEQIRKVSNFFGLLLFVAVETAVCVQILMILIKFLIVSYHQTFGV